MAHSWVYGLHTAHTLLQREPQRVLRILVDETRLDRRMQAIIDVAGQHGLPLERVLLDLHSGRIFGEAGVWLVDAAALLFLLLAGSGLWLWGRRHASGRARERDSKARGTQP